ncbi:hypothetical protein BAUCODRAFT_32091 [Baudoinia panamericana UAMH 10762]|uniref:PQ loop repeat protein n=1 Tax=Baudoinia panamericana (strain UAMH 10762) TaxID=717646 RepID=M2NGH6_BAUPA|nr:uncharacterized protein BAUCODRAFT_32091 [Baudoinia panamericana UAMH 10762]EMC98095.1 hypothetical protein BAUCODRAFT_32091 [Baudoinia panamericana UAMH 10762]
MQWLTSIALEPALPAHCEPTTDFLLRFSSAFHTCVPTPLAFASNTLGALSIVAWLFAQLPQIYKNWSIASTSGLSFSFLLEWYLGDVSNLLGALFTHQANWQVAIGAYYVFVDSCLLAQWVWYEKLQHGSIVRRAWPKPGYNVDGRRDGGMEEVIIEGMPVDAEAGDAANRPDAGLMQATAKQPTRPQIIFRAPTFREERSASPEKGMSSHALTPGGTTIHRIGASSPLPSPSPRTVLLLACLMALAQAHSPTQIAQVFDAHHASRQAGLETAGTVLSWLSTALYLGSRFPQLIKNWRRKSTAGLSPHLFIAAFCGNLLYSTALTTNPCAWYDFGAYGGGGWVGAEGSRRAQWVLAALPFFLGAAGVLGLDACVGIQFVLYGDDAKVVVIEEDRWHRRHWRKVSGWMRGWVPSISEGKGNERDALIVHDDVHSNGYGTAA